MRRLTDILLPLAGVLYPFVVYFGTDRVSPPLLALLLGAIWLIRAPALLRQPGGRWMVLAALAYCVLLAVSGASSVLRWYPALISALLLTVFALSLRYGPPMVERFARLREPHLEPAGVRYTRTLTWVWIGFFIFNAGMSAALTLWAPLTWWTLYNGLLAYLLMAALLGGEWLLRQRLRALA
jgi:uncharacterized membrane protein